jgi:sortase A
MSSIVLASGSCLLAWPLFVVADSSYAQWSGQRQLAYAAAQQETILNRKPSAPSARPVQKPGGPLGKFEIPRLKLSYVLLEGTDNRTLDKSIGHVEGTALIGETGNIGIAGHRNTHFRKLEWIRRGDELILTGRAGEYRYHVEWVRLFNQHDLEVLAPEHGPAVTLVTCFPFEYVGAAPLRYIVRALPDEATRARLQAAPGTAQEKPADE